MKAIKRLVSRMNDIFIRAVLVLFYFIGLGLAFLLRGAFHRSIPGNTYWKDAGKPEVNLQSPY